MSQPSRAERRRSSRGGATPPPKKRDPMTPIYIGFAAVLVFVLAEFAKRHFGRQQNRRTRPNDRRHSMRNQRSRASPFPHAPGHYGQRLAVADPRIYRLCTPPRQSERNVPLLAAHARRQRHHSHRSGRRQFTKRRSLHAGRVLRHLGSAAG